MRPALFVLLAPLLAACPSDPKHNPPRLWLALDGSEINIQLIDHEPDPF